MLTVLPTQHHTYRQAAAAVDEASGKHEDLVRFEEHGEWQDVVQAAPAFHAAAVEAGHLVDHINDVLLVREQNVGAALASAQQMLEALLVASQRLRESAHQLQWGSAEAALGVRSTAGLDQCVRALESVTAATAIRAELVACNER